MSVDSLSLRLRVGVLSSGSIERASRRLKVDPIFVSVPVATSALKFDPYVVGDRGRKSEVAIHGFASFEAFIVDGRGR
jgi:hypothetical protein